ncbi:MAG: alanine--tRNA ligase, partial [Firmicutes bacterium]|nr:alanine--tRNA ligase [Bacillota bacterium]
MEKLGLNTIREMFLDYFEKQGHFRRGSYSLIPESDKSLLLIGAGMAPLKPYFAGLETPPSKRMTTCQKCIRTGDLENVGHTDRHGTFFEMLGNFSFGDYFKKEAITWAWDFATTVLKLPAEKLWVTIYEEDDEARALWRDMIGIPEEKIVPLGKDDNFWEIGVGGPCGPCSEIYFDRGEEHGCGSPDCKPGCECDRYVEFWNLVFTQFIKEEDGSYTPLPHPNIDTGMGLERIACIMQDTSSIFDVDTIQYVLKEVSRVSGVSYQQGKADTDVSMRIITDHLRSMTFMISDGILPGNEGREYVLRRLIRRAARHGRLLGIEGSFLAALSEKVVDVSGKAYPELEKQRVFIHKVIAAEEANFAATIDQGMKIIEEYTKEMKDAQTDVLDGEKAFKLHDTYGFPIDLTKEIMAESGFGVDEEGFTRAMDEQKKRSQQTGEMEGAGWEEAAADFVFEGETDFVGYTEVGCKGWIKAMIKDNEPVDVLSEGDEGIVILDRTPFYAEGGGQASDTGMIYNDDGSAIVERVEKLQSVYAHHVKVRTGRMANGSEVLAGYDEIRRNRTAANHTATHLLQKALQEVLGDHVKQAGSSVTMDGLRFDFSHYQAMTADEIAKVEDIVNDKIGHFINVTTETMAAKDAFKSGAMALFGEKYGDTVRVVSIGDFSKELCGGTHVSNTGQVGAFRIVSESGVASGVRRIEAITGLGILEHYVKNERVLGDLTDVMKVTRDNIMDKASSLLGEVKSLKKEIEAQKQEKMSAGMGSLIDEAKEVNGIRLICKQFDSFGIDDLRSIADG